MYIMASSWSRGSNAKLEMAVPRNKTSCCLVFYYHMYGAAMGTLNVFNGNKNIFTKSGNQGNYWKRVSRTVYFTDLVSMRVIFILLKSSLTAYRFHPGLHFPTQSL